MKRLLLLLDFLCPDFLISPEREIVGVIKPLTGKKLKTKSFTRCLIISIILIFSCLSSSALCGEERDPSNTFSDIFTPEDAKKANLPAFPNAEGGGKYTTGGRGGDVYYVTNLNDSGEGSLREGISTSDRTILFSVSGTIYLESPLVLSRHNITIAGQTAPGDGICIANYPTQIAADNIIIRYIRFRMGSGAGAEGDALWGRRQKNIIIDHCSASWSTDETISIYGIKNTTVQWCIASESLTLSSHAKGRHGYGGIWGGSNVTYHHNLIATHTSRMPRYLNSDENHPDYPNESSNDMVNNLFYNWGFNSGCGAENDTRVNIENNYYKAGPQTNENVYNQIFNPYNKGFYYVYGNVMEGFSGIDTKVTNDNWSGIRLSGDTSPTKYTNPYTNGLYRLSSMHTAIDTRGQVLINAGATLPRRDSYDAKIINDVRYGTGRAINHENEAGGYPELKSNPFLPVDSDFDGIPDDWEDTHELNKFDYSDRNNISRSGYTYLEDYLNDIGSEAGSIPTNPYVKITSFDDNLVIPYGSPVNIVAEASANSGNRIVSVKFYQNDKLLTEKKSFPYSYNWVAPKEGTYYLSVKAIDSEGLETLSAVKAVHVNNVSDILPWKSQDVGVISLKGSASVNDGIYTVKSAGLIGPEKESGLSENGDSFHFMYQTVGNSACLSAKIESVSRLANNCVTGIMIRDSMDTFSDFALINYEYEKNGAGLAFTYRKNGEYVKNFIKAEALPVYVRLQKNNENVCAFLSQDGVSWALLDTAALKFKDTINFAGIAIDGNKEYNGIYNYSHGKFSDLVLHDYKENSVPSISISLTTQLDKRGLTPFSQSGNSEKKQQYTIEDSISLNLTSSLNTVSKIELYKNNELIHTTDKPISAFKVPNLSAGNYWFTAKVYDKNGYVNSESLNVGINKLENGFLISEIGQMPLRAAVEMNGDKITLQGMGLGIDQNTGEQTPYIYKSISGDSSMSIKIDAQELSDYEHSGIMVRTNLEEGSKSYVLYFQPYNGVLFKYRAQDDGQYINIKQRKFKNTPVWLKLQKIENQLKASYSKDGITFEDIGEIEVDFNNYYIGIFSSATEEYNTHDVTFSDFKLEIK